MADLDFWNAVKETETMQTQMKRVGRVNENALDRYMAHTERARQLVNELQLWVEDHGEVAPDDVNWNHVGTMSMVADTLEEALEVIRLDEDLEPVHK